MSNLQNKYLLFVNNKNLIVLLNLLIEFWVFFNKKYKKVKKLKKKIKNLKFIENSKNRIFLIKQWISKILTKNHWNIHIKKELLKIHCFYTKIREK